MKHLTNNSLFGIRALLVGCLLLAVSQLVSCSKASDAPSATESTTAKLIANTWKISNVTVDGAVKTSMFTNFTLHFTATSYTTTNNGPVWPSSGSWSFTDAEATSILRSDGLIIQIMEATDSTLKLRLTWTLQTYGPGRVGSISGQHIFSFTK